MLVLIVVAAATAFGAFITSYQKTLQAEEQVTHDRALESLKTITALTTLNGTGTNGQLLVVNFTVASLDQNPTILTGLDVDNQPINNYTAYELNLTTGSVDSIVVAAGGQLHISANQQLAIAVDVSAGSASNSFYIQSFGLTDRSYVQVDLFTYLANDFRTIFLPPTAIALVTSLQSFVNGSTPTTVPALSGINSIQPQPGNATIVSWNWTAVTLAPPGATWTGSGEEVVPTFSIHPASYTITLIVTNNYGLVGSDVITYFAS